MKTLLYFIAFLLFVSCGNKVEYGGDAMINYPDMPVILKENVLPYETGSYMYQEMINDDGKISKKTLKASDVDWKKYTEPFLAADIHKQKYDRMYGLDFFEDEMAQTRTYLYSALNKTIKTTKISLSVRSADNAILSLYAETNDAGLLNSKSYKLLLASGKTIQIQEKSKKPFSKAKHIIRTLTFLN